MSGAPSLEDLRSTAAAATEAHAQAARRAVPKEEALAVARENKAPRGEIRRLEDLADSAFDEVEAAATRKNAANNLASARAHDEERSLRCRDLDAAKRFFDARNVGLYTTIRKVVPDELESWSAAWHALDLAERELARYDGPVVAKFRHGRECLEALAARLLELSFRAASPADRCEVLVAFAAPTTKRY